MDCDHCGHELREVSDWVQWCPNCGSLLILGETLVPKYTQITEPVD